MNQENFTTILFWFLWGLSTPIAYSTYAYFFQLKEYRWDRLKDFSLTQEGHRVVLGYHFFPRTLILFSLYVLFADMVPVSTLLMLVFGLDLCIAIYTYGQKRLRRPMITKKILLLLSASLLTEAIFLFLLYNQPLLLFLLGIRVVPLTLWVAVLHFPTWTVKRLLIFRATKKILRYPRLVTVGITGSYGKTSTKEFTSHILSQKYRVLKTPKNVNTDIGVAKFILSQNFDDVNIFVCEMGAYRTGEIQSICDMVRPKIGVLTAIAEQHLSLFGSINNIQQAKYELLRSIPVDGLVITNADNPYCTQFLEELRCARKETFGLDLERNPSCLTTDIKTTLTGTNFRGVYHGVEGSVSTPVIGAHHATNIAAAVVIAAYLGLSREQILHGCETLPTDVHGSLQIFQYGKAVIIDDSYNSNPIGFRSALDVLSLFPSQRKRIVITRGMLELGKKSEELHEQIGEEISLIADQLVVITKDFYKALERGVGTRYNTKIQLQLDTSELLTFIQSLKHEEAVILLENKIPSRVYAEIQAQKHL